MGSKATSNSNLSLECHLEAGEYICLARVKWLYSPEHHFVLASYGPTALSFTEVAVKENFLAEFIRLKSAEEIGDKSYYGKLGSPQSYRIVFMSSDLGYGYIIICNNEETKKLKGSMLLDRVQGIKMIPPLDFRIKFEVKPKSREVFPCVVSPNGFEYKIFEELTLI